jgi:hypothetical protein
MKKLLFIFSLLVLLIAVVVPLSHAMGPIIVSAHNVTWDKVVQPQVTGYYVYWRVQGATTWSDTNRSPVLPQPSGATMPKYDLLQWITANGTYEICATSRTAAGDESGPSNVVPFVLFIPPSPLNCAIPSTP